MDSFEKYLNTEELAVINALDTPFKLQQFIDSLSYPSGEENRSPVEVLRSRQAHCLDGGLFAVAVLYRLGFPPMIIDILPYPDTDDDHILALFMQNGRWGCVAKSNFMGLRYRPPVFRSFRELVMSYFPFYFNLNRVYSIWGYSGPLNLTRYFSMDWIGNHAMLDLLEKDLKKKHGRPLVTDAIHNSLDLLDEKIFQACSIGTNFDGAFKPLK
jgi:hypothetical protein